MKSPSRRDFLKRSGILSLGFLGLQRVAWAQEARTGSAPWRNVFGPLVTDAQGIMNLPRGFNLRVISVTGRWMEDGFRTPGAHDGMGAFAGPDGQTILVCNHELKADWQQLGPGAPRVPFVGSSSGQDLYDPGTGGRPCVGGTTTIVYDTREQRRIRQFLSLRGTESNCAGGPTPWGSWITCEETTVRAGGGYARDHGYNFEVPATAEMRRAAPVPLKAMGRFKHEAIAVEPTSGIVYQTEDLGDGLIYRFIPAVPGALAEGGRLQALALIDRDGADTRNWPISREKMATGESFPVRWIDLDDVEAPRDDLRHRGRAAGAATFARGEGIFHGNGELYWCCTNGGPSLLGQVFRYVPSPFEGTAREAGEPGLLELFVESRDANVLKNCDNCVVAPWGDLIVAEDADAPCRLIGVTAEGSIYPLAKNVLNGSELAGPCFSPDGSTLFVNIQRPGLTLAITGPWPERAEEGSPPRNRLEGNPLSSSSGSS